MASYKLYEQLNLAAIDQDILNYWAEKQIFERSVSEREGAENFVFYEGPPSANGRPGIHHVLARSVKDSFCRYQSMKGKMVRRKAGWDTHGLPIELAVEKKLGITKEDIGQKISIEEYNQACKETVMEFKDLWDKLTVKMGYWVDLDKPYVTYEPKYMETVWWLLARLYNKGLLYKGLTVQPYSPAAGTGLSSHELNQPGCYKDVSDNTVVAMFKVQKSEQSAFLFDDEDEDVRFLAWTTTPWTLPSNTALTVGPKIEYVKIKTTSPYTELPVSVVLAKALVKKWMGGKKQPQIIQSSEPFTGKDLAGIRYEQLLNYGNPIEPLQGQTDAFRIILGQFVTTEDGTGIVHTAPSFGADDRMAAQKAGIGALTLVDKQGRFKENVGPFSGRYVKDYENLGKEFRSVDVDIVIHLKTENLAFNAQKYSHNYPHCWRTDKPILYYPLDSWFIQASSVKERMYELNKTINWKPASTGEGRFGGWLENLQDWNLSRSRFWGIPLPIWRTKDGSEERCIGSLEELMAAIEQSVAAGLMQSNPYEGFVPNDFSEENYAKVDLHKHIVDKIVLCASNGEPMYRESDLIDVWFDSGSMPYAQQHYPFENKELIDNAIQGKEGARAFPADFIAEGVDQTRGWFYTLHAIATMAFDQVAYKNVVSNGLVLDKNGKKMSKRLGNAVEPFETIDKYGADATRWYMLTNAQPWDNLKFDVEGLDEVRRKLFGTLYNTYIFFATYANIDEFDGQSIKEFAFKGELELAKRPEIDRWIISKLNSLVKEVDQDMSDYEPTNAGRKIANFVDAQLSNWYVRLCRRRFWKGEQNEDKLAAYQTLYTVLETLSRLMAPIAPFFSDFLYLNLQAGQEGAGKDSVHLADFPAANLSAIVPELEQRMDYAQRISSMVHALRRLHKIRVRQPLQRILLPILDEGFEAQVEAVKDLILSEVNVKAIEYVRDSSGILKKGVKPNFKVLGKRLGKQMKAAKMAIEAMTQADIQSLEKAGQFMIDLEGTATPIHLEEVQITSEDIEGWLVTSDNEIVVALDENISEELKAEGMARELVNRIQNLRKDQQLEVTDRIQLKLEKQPAIQAAIDQFADYISREVLAQSLEVVEGLNEGAEIELYENLALHIWLDKA